MFHPDSKGSIAHSFTFSNLDYDVTGAAIKVEDPGATGVVLGHSTGVRALLVAGGVADYRS